jgi:phage gp46-like protein
VSDVALRWGLEGGDLDLQNGDLRVDEGLATACLASVFTDGLGPENPERPITEQDRRGWWADIDEPYGSLVWTLGRAKATTAALGTARAAFEQGLAWLIDEGIAKKITTTAVYSAPGRMQVSVSIERGTARRWSALWRASSDVHLVAGDVALELAFT